MLGGDAVLAPTVIITQSAQSFEARILSSAGHALLDIGDASGEKVAERLAATCRRPRPAGLRRKVGRSTRRRDPCRHHCSGHPDRPGARRGLCATRDSRAASPRATTSVECAPNSSTGCEPTAVTHRSSVRAATRPTRRASHPPTLAVHRDPDPGSFEYFSELLAGELAALVGVEDLRPARPSRLPRLNGRLVGRVLDLLEVMGAKISLGPFWLVRKIRILPPVLLLSLLFPQLERA